MITEAGGEGRPESSASGERGLQRGGWAVSPGFYRPPWSWLAAVLVPGILISSQLLNSFW